MKVLAIDTSTEACSAAVLRDDDRVVSRFVLTERSHAELILPMVDEVLRESGLTLTQLDGLAFGRGPGGFTGVRVAAGVIQGLAFGAGLPVAPVSSLAAVAANVCFTSTAASGAAEDSISAVAAGELRILVCNDARMHEVYWAAYCCVASEPSTLRPLTDERVTAPDAIVIPDGVTHCAGNAFMRYPPLRERLVQAGLQVHDNMYPHAAAIARVGAAMLRDGRGVAAADALPTYVRDDVARPSGGPVTTVS
jgi:tRNA threonylcarbamoyladenosine biosynthesis protein TsaB